MLNHVKNFINSRLEEDLRLNVSEDVKVYTPVALLKGHQGLRKFHDLLQEYLPSSVRTLKSLEFHENSAIFHWREVCATACVEDGKCVSEFQEGKLVRQHIECEIKPDVMNQG